MQSLFDFGVALVGASTHVFKKVVFFTALYGGLFLFHTWKFDLLHKEGVILLGCAFAWFIIWWLSMWEYPHWGALGAIAFIAWTTVSNTFPGVTQGIANTAHAAEREFVRATSQLGEPKVIPCDESNWRDMAFFIQHPNPDQLEPLVWYSEQDGRITCWDAAGNHRSSQRRPVTEEIIRQIARQAQRTQEPEQSASGNSFATYVPPP